MYALKAFLKPLVLALRKILSCHAHFQIDSQSLNCETEQVKLGF